MMTNPLILCCSQEILEGCSNIIEYVGVRFRPASDLFLKNLFILSDINS